MLASSGFTVSAPSLAFDQETVSIFAGRNLISWSGAVSRTKPEIRRRLKACT